MYLLPLLLQKDHQRRGFSFVTPHENVDLSLAVISAGQDKTFHMLLYNDHSLWVSYVQEYLHKVTVSQLKNCIYKKHPFSQISQLFKV